MKIHIRAEGTTDKLNKFSTVLMASNIGTAIDPW